MKNECYKYVKLFSYFNFIWRLVKSIFSYEKNYKTLHNYYNKINL